MYNKLSKTFSAEEKFRLVDQLSCAAISIPANIAESYGRKGKKEKIHFL